MKKGLIVGIGISCCIILFMASMEFFLRAIPNDFNRKIQAFNRQKDQIEILILGSSHTYVGLNPAEFSSPTFNMAFSSQTVDLDAKLLERLNNQLPRLKTVILPISYFSYVLCLEDGTSAHKIKNYNIYYGIYSHTHRWKNQMELFHLPWKQSIQRLKRFRIDPYNEIHIDQNGFIAKRYVKSKMDSIQSAQHAVANHSQNLKDKNIQARIDSNVQAIESIIRWCNSHHVKLLLVTPPVQQVYLDRLNPQQLQHMRQTTQQIIQRHPEVSWWNDMDATHLFTPQDFQNPDHLSKQGATHWSKRINAKLHPKN